MDFLLDDLVVDLTFNPNEPRDSKGRWTRTAVMAAIDHVTDIVERFVRVDGGPDRKVMPQLSGVPIPGSKADALPHAPGEEVDLTAEFEKELRARGVSVTDTELRVSVLKPTQDQIIAKKVEGIANYLMTNPAPDAPIYEPIFVTRDDYVVDGHHRWAARYVKDEVMNTDSVMAVRQMGLNKDDAMTIANNFMDEWGLPRAGMNDKGALVSAFAKPGNPDATKTTADDIKVGDKLDPRGTVRVHAARTVGDEVHVFYKQRGSKSPGMRTHKVGEPVTVYHREKAAKDLAVDLGEVIDLADYSSLAKPGYTGPRRTSDEERAIAHALMRKGKSKSQAIAMARGLLKKAARSGRWGDHGKASARTRAKALASIAQRKTF